MANRHSYHERYTENQAMCKPTDTGTDHKIGDFSLFHIYISILNVTGYAV